MTPFVPARNSWCPLLGLTMTMALVAGCGPTPSSEAPERSRAAEPAPPERPVAVAPAAPVSAVPVAAPVSVPVSAEVAAIIARLDDPQRHGSAEATTWNLAAPLEVPLHVPGLARDGGVVCWMRPSDPTRSVVVDVTISGTRPLTGRMTLGGSGWRRVWCPVRALSEGEAGAGGPAVVRWTAVGDVPSGYTVAVAGVQAVADGRTIVGPSVDDDGLLAGMDWTRADLAAARERLVAGDRAGALHAVATAVRQPVAGWAWPTALASKTDAADAFLKGQVSLLGLTHTFANGTIDWQFNPTKGDKASNEWVWSINRHSSWGVVADAFRATGNVTYATGWAHLMHSWMQQIAVPAVQDEKAGSAWRDLEAGLRLNRTWIDSFEAVKGSPAVSDDDILTLMRSVWDHGSYLSVCHVEPSNHFLIGQTGLFNAGSQFPWFRDAARWRRLAGEHLQVALEGGSLSEGAWYEMSPGYHQWVTTKLLDVWDVAELRAQTAELPLALKTKLQKMAEWGLRLMGPTGDAPCVNDGGPLVLATINLERTARRFPDSALIAWARATKDGAPATPPSWTSERLPDSGYAVMRTGWGRQDSYLLLDTGPLGGWHGHQDALNVVAWFRGRYFLFDNGGYKYDSSAWRAWGPTTAAHNTVLVDGFGQRRTWFSEVDAIGAQPAGQPAALFGTSPAVDYASGWYVCGYGKNVPNRGKASNVVDPTPATHRREVVFLKSLAVPVMVVVDTLTPSDSAAHRYEVRWHLKSTQWKEDRGGAVTWTTDAGKPNLAVISLGAAEDVCHADSGVKKPELLGWWFEGQNGDPSPALTLRRQRSATGVTRLVTVMAATDGVPDGSPVTAVEAAGQDAWTVRLQGVEQPVTIRLQESGLRPTVAVDGVPLPTVR